MNKVLLGLCLLGMLVFNSCKTRKITYVKDMEPNAAYTIPEITPLQIQKGDRLSITISAKNAELAAPFNDVLGAYRMSTNGEVMTGLSQGALIEKGYLVNNEGNIEFPIFGNLAVENKSIAEIRTMIAKRLKDEKYIADPIIKVELMNMKVNMLGEIGSTGVISVPDSRINLLEAIAKSNGLTRNAATDKVMVIREENGIRKIYVNDIESKDIFNSPTFQLKQNDIVYVQQRDGLVTTKADNTWRVVSMATGFISLILSIITIARQ